MIEAGNRIWWRAMNRDYSGIVEKIDGDTFSCRLDNGKYMIVDILSIIKWEKR